MWLLKQTSSWYIVGGIVFILFVMEGQSLHLYMYIFFFLLSCMGLFGKLRVCVFALQSGCEEKVVQCGVCGKVFSGRSRKHNLKQHTLTHTGERPHICPHCPYRSSHRPTLRRHVLTVHANLAHHHAPLQNNPPSFSYTR